MSQKFENLSALVDGEQIDASLLDQLQKDAELADKWQRYHLIRDGLRQELPKTQPMDFAAKVMQAIELEPVILAPKRTWRDLPVVSKVVPFAKQSGQMAIAASVAVAMILGVQQYNQPEYEQPFSPAAPAILGIQGGLSPVSLQQTRALPRTDVAEQRKRITAYLTDHQQQMRLKSVLNQSGETISVKQQEQAEPTETIDEQKP